MTTLAWIIAAWFAASALVGWREAIDEDHEAWAVALFGAVLGPIIAASRLFGRGR